MELLSSEKVFSADNQQERLVKIGWITGFVDGEGCFSVNFIKQPDRQEPARVRKGYKTGYQVAHEFAVTQGAKSLESLQLIRDFFGIGNIYLNKRYDNHNEHLYKYVVRKRSDLVNTIIPFFQRYTLRTAKKESFRIFTDCMNLICEGKHLTREGAIQVATMCREINHKKSRTDIISILRNHTSDSLRVNQFAMRR